MSRRISRWIWSCVVSLPDGEKVWFRVQGEGEDRFRVEFWDEKGMSIIRRGTLPECVYYADMQRRKVLRGGLVHIHSGVEAKG